MDLKEAIKICEDNGKIVVDLDDNNFKHLSFEVVMKIAANINRVSTSDMIRKRRGTDPIVNSCWLFMHYFYSATSLSYAEIAKQLNKDHATLIHSVRENSSPFLSGWRLSNKELFLNKINELHKKLGMKEFKYKDYGKR